MALYVIYHNNNNNLDKDFDKQGLQFKVLGFHILSEISDFCVAWDSLSLSTALRIRLQVTFKRPTGRASLAGHVFLKVPSGRGC